MQVATNKPQRINSAAPDPLARPGAVRRERMAQSFADVVAVLMRDPGFRYLRLADLEWLVIPPVMSAQFRLGKSRTEGPGGKDGARTPDDQSEERGVLVPSAVALWASVSAPIDKRLSEDLDQPLVLRPTEWLSGDHLWLIAVAGDRRALPVFVDKLKQDVFKDRQVKLRAKGPAHSAVVKTLNPGH